MRLAGKVVRMVPKNIGANQPRFELAHLGAAAAPQISENEKPDLFPLVNVLLIL